MDYERDIAFFCRLMQKYGIQTLRFDPQKAAELDAGLRHSLGLVLDEDVLKILKDNTLYFVQDVFLCRYNVFKLPGKSEALVIGPYLTQDVSEYQLMSILEKNNPPMSLLPVLM